MIDSGTMYEERGESQAVQNVNFAIHINEWHLNVKIV